MYIACSSTTAFNIVVKHNLWPTKSKTILKASVHSNHLVGHTCIFNLIHYSQPGLSPICKFFTATKRLFCILSKLQAWLQHNFKCFCTLSMPEQIHNHGNEYLMYVTASKYVTMTTGISGVTQRLHLPSLLYGTCWKVGLGYVTILHVPVYMRVFVWNLLKFL